MTLVKTSILNGIAVGVKMLTSLVLNKLLALYVGPSGYAVIGQFQNIVTMLTSFVTSGMTNGVTKYTAEYYDDKTRQRRLWQTAATITFAAWAIAVVLILPLRHFLAAKVLGNPGYSGVFTWLAISLLFLGLNALLLSVLNGKKDVAHYVMANMSGSVLSLVMTGLLAWRYGLYGALVALSINQSIVFFATVFLCRRAGWLRLNNFIGRIDFASAKGLANFAAMGAIAAFALPMCQILIRNHLRIEFGWNYAGCWEAMSRISAMYLQLVTTTLSLYYLPRIAEIRGNKELRREILHVFRFVVPATMAASLTIFLFRGIIIRLLFTGEFQLMDQLFAFQMLGDVVKIASWVIAFVMIGRALVGWYVVTEIGASLSYWGLTVLLTRQFGFQGAAIAYFVNYLLYFGVVYLIVIHQNRSIAAE
jgi:PST family polysaccharide transporter